MENKTYRDYNQHGFNWSGNDDLRILRIQRDYPVIAIVDYRLGNVKAFPMFIKTEHTGRSSRKPMT
jgi:hypothetical protein